MRQRHSLLLSEVLFLIVETRSRGRCCSQQKGTQPFAHTRLTAHLFEMGLAAQH